MTTPGKMSRRASMIACAAVVTGLVFSMSACASTPNDQLSDDQIVSVVTSQKSWGLPITGGDEYMQYPSAGEPVLLFENDMTFGGNNGCRWVFGEWSIEEQTITLSNFSNQSTGMDELPPCKKDKVSIEDGFQMRLDDEERVLRVTDTDGEFVIVLPPFQE